MKLTDMYMAGFGESEIVTKKCVTVVAMVTVTFQNGCSFAFKIQWSAVFSGINGLQFPDPWEL